MKAEELANERFPSNLYNEDTRGKLMYGFIEGYNQATKGAVEGVLVDNIDGTQDICLHGKRFGQKVRVIVLKEEE